MTGSAHAATAAATIAAGVGKSGSPAPNPMTGRPAALSALAFASTASVADSEMADTRADILVVGMLPWCHLRLCHHQSVSPAAERPPGGPARGTALTQGNPHLVRLGSTFGIHSGGCKNRRAVAQLVESRSPK